MKGIKGNAPRFRSSRGIKLKKSIIYMNKLKEFKDKLENEEDKN